MMTDADSDLYTFDEDLGLRTRYFVLSGFRDKSEEKSIRRKIEELGGQNLYDVVWNDQITHVISKSFESTELVLAGKSVNLNTIYPSNNCNHQLSAGLAAGRWVLEKRFVDESHQKGYFLNAKKYVHDECVVTHRKNWKRFDNNRSRRLAGGQFYNMKALFVMDDLEGKERYQRIVYAGGKSDIYCLEIKV